MTTVIKTDKINNIIFFNPKIIKDNEYKRGKYNKILDTNDEKLTVFPNEDETEAKKVSLFKSFRESLYKDIRKSGKFCDGLSALYVKDSLKDCDAVLKIESSWTRSKKINGFTTLKFFKNSKSLYIDVICTSKDIKGVGTYIMNLLTDLCKKLSFDSIKLSSATQAVPFYLKTDFECNPMCKMIKMVGGNKTRKNRDNSNSRTKRVY